MMSGPQPGRRRSRRVGRGRQGWPLFFYGLAFFTLGVVITVVTYSAASNGGHYIISYGPIIVGLIAMVRGLVDVARNQRARSQQPGVSGPGWPPSAGGPQDALSQPSPPSYGPAGYGPAGYGPAGYGPAGYGPAGYGPAGGEPGTADGPGFALPRAGQAGSPGFAAASGTVPIPASPNMVAPPNWYADPRDVSQLRWWDGQAWTSHTRPRY